MALGVLLIGSGYVLCAPPSGFSPGSIVRIREGASVPEISTMLADANVIAHPVALRILLRILGKSDTVQSGVYQFKEPQDVFAVAYRITAGDYGLPPTRVTFTEGTTVREMAIRIAQAFPDMPIDEFHSLAEPQEGYLFPDTYFFLSSVDAKMIVAAMRKNFDVKMAPLLGDIQASGHSLSDTVVMASLVEKEARTSEVRRVVAGILWSRLRLGMPLQVDAVFGYIFGKDTYSPSFADLKADSPYNTYTHTGLPPGPICNPGLDALSATIHPAQTDYLYYLTDKDGLMHYATTYAGHQANRRKYLP